MKMHVENITPTVAAEMLRNNTGNRKVNPSSVQILAAQMKENSWKLNGEPIIISDQGNLMDGQHRLLALINSGVTLSMLVVRGVKQDAFDTIDVGRNRSGSDLLSIEGLSSSHAQCLSTTIRIDTAVKNIGTLSQTKKMYHLITPAKILQSYRENDEYLRCVKFVMENSPSPHQRPLPAGLLGFLTYRTFQIDEDFSSDWIKRFISGIGVSENENIMHLRDKFWAENNSRRKTPQNVRLLWTIKAWHLDRKGSFMKYQRSLCKGGIELLKHVSLPTDLKSK